MAAAFDAKTAAWTTASGASPVSVTNLTVGSGSNRAMAVCIMCGSGGSGLPAGLTLVWDSVGANQSLTQISGTLTLNAGNAAASAIYGLIAPASGNKTLTISWAAGSNEVHACAIAFT